MQVVNAPTRAKLYGMIILPLPAWRIQAGQRTNLALPVKAALLASFSLHSSLQEFEQYGRDLVGASLLFHRSASCDENKLAYAQHVTRAAPIQGPSGPARRHQALRHRGTALDRVILDTRRCSRRW